MAQVGITITDDPDDDTRITITVVSDPPLHVRDQRRNTKAQQVALDAVNNMLENGDIHSVTAEE